MSTREAVEFSWTTFQPDFDEIRLKRTQGGLSSLIL